MSDWTPAERDALLRNDFFTFFQFCFQELYPAAVFLDNWHIQVLCAQLLKCQNGDVTRQIINVPPRSLKSSIVSIAYVAWFLGHSPAAQIIVVSYAQDLADKLSRDCRTIMESAWYCRIFPQTRLSQSKKSAEEFVTTAKGGRLATSVGGVLTGRGADCIVIDDALKPQDALSEARRKACNEFYDGTLLSRLNDKKSGRIIIVMQRLHQDDLVGHVLAQENWNVLSLPAVAPEDRTYVIDTLYGQRTFVWREGEPLQAAREPLEVLAQLRSAMGEYVYAGQYLQSPIPYGGAMIKEAWFQRYDPAETRPQFDQVIQSWDTASKPTELADFSVCTTWGVKDAQYFLLDVQRKRLSYPDLKRKVVEHAAFFKATTILIEDKASGIQLLQELQLAGLAGVTAYQPKGDKRMRMNAQSDLFENGRIFLPREAHWLGDYTSELTSFPFSKYDDQVDSTSQALEWIKSRDFGPGIGFLQFAESQLRQWDEQGLIPRRRA